MASIKEFQTTLPPAGTLNAQGLRRLNASSEVIRWAQEGVQLPWLKGQPKAAYFKNNNMDLFANSDWVPARIS